jgi:hypothetical protein
VGLPIACVMNTATGREASESQPVRLEGKLVSSTLAVIGAGPAGMAAAVSAAQHGKRVTIFEVCEAIGGQLRMAGSAPEHQSVWKSWVLWAERSIEDYGIEVRLGEQPTTKALVGFESVIAATGARPYRDAAIWAAPTRRKLLDAWQILDAPNLVDGPVLITDWGGDPTGLDCAELLLGLGLRVYYSYAGPSPVEQVHQYQRNGYLARLDVDEITMLPHMELAVGADELVLRNVFSGRIREIPPEITTIVASHGRVPVAFAEADDMAGRINVIGDAMGPRGLEEAMLEGSRAGAKKP